jgi:cellulose synthase/poly-beta-1,6-N-acetylglucosamine synthase-like glycosyltransferase
MSRHVPEPLPLADLPAGARISFAITCYNYGRFLAQCLDGCLAQSHPADEIVLIDDGSTDDSWEVAQDYMARCPQIKAFREKNAGMCGAANAAIAACSGDVILLIDADDIPHPQRVERVLAALRTPVDGRLPGWVHHLLRRFSVASPDLGLIPYYPSAATAAPSATDPTAPTARASRSTAALPAPRGYLAGWVTEIVQCPVYTPMSGLAFRRELLEAIGPLDSDRGMAQDMQLSLAGCLLSPVAYIDEALTAYRIHGQSDSAGGLLASLSKVKMIRRRYERLDPWITQLYRRHRPQGALPWKPLPEQPSYQWLEFLDDWWSGSGKDLRLLGRVLRHPQIRTAPLQRRLYLYGAVYLPKPWFLRFSRLVHGSSPLKAFVRRRLGRR